MTNKLNKSIKIEPKDKICRKCNVLKTINHFRLEPTDSNPKSRRNQCNECRNTQRNIRNKKTGYWSKRYRAMSEEERKIYIKKKSKQNQYRFKTNPEALRKKKEHDKSDRGIFSRYKGDCNRRGRLKRGIKMLLEFEEFRDLINQKCYLCGMDNCRGVDRVDSEESYTPENCKPCCKICNQMKNDMTEKYFIDHMKKILERVR